MSNRVPAVPSRQWDVAAWTTRDELKAVFLGAQTSFRPRARTRWKPALPGENVHPAIVRGLCMLGALLVALAGMLAPVMPARAALPQAAPELSLPAALRLMPEMPAIRAAGVWYSNYALAKRVYGVSGIDTMTNPAIGRFFAAIASLKPGPETGITGLTMGRWRQIYGYDMFQLSGEIYSQPPGKPSHTIAIAAGRLDAAYIGDLLVTSGYTRSLLLHNRLYVRSTLPGGPMNALALTPGRLVAGNWPQDVITTSLRLQEHVGTLGQDNGYRGLATVLGAVQGAYLAANVPPSPFQASPFPTPPDGHTGPPLHHFGLYAVADQEPRPGRRVMEIALAYSRHADALADVPALRARLGRESISSYSARWRDLTTIAGISVRGKVLLIRLHLRPSTAPTLWLDAVDEEDLSILSR